MFLSSFFFFFSRQKKDVSSHLKHTSFGKSFSLSLSLFRFISGTARARRTGGGEEEEEEERGSLLLRRPRHR